MVDFLSDLDLAGQVWSRSGSDLGQVWGRSEADLEVKSTEKGSFSQNVGHPWQKAENHVFSRYLGKIVIFNGFWSCLARTKG